MEDNKNVCSRCGKEIPFNGRFCKDCLRDLAKGNTDVTKKIINDPLKSTEDEKSFSEEYEILKEKSRGVWIFGIVSLCVTLLTFIPLIIFGFITYSDGYKKVGLTAIMASVLAMVINILCVISLSGMQI